MAVVIFTSVATILASLSDLLYAITIAHQVQLNSSQYYDNPCERHTPVAKIDEQKEVFASRSLLQQAVGVCGAQTDARRLECWERCGHCHSRRPSPSNYYVNPNRTDLVNTFETRRRGHILGTDEIGRSSGPSDVPGQVSLGIASPLA
jgi:hypothetical protein